MSKLRRSRFLTRLALNLYPPYLGTGIRVTTIASDWRELKVQMKLRWYNRNLVGTHFGGSLYAMVDPHLMLLLTRLLGDDYVVWDQAARVTFVRPGTGTISAVLRIDAGRLAEIRDRTCAGEPFRPVFDLAVVDEQDEIVARVEKTLYVRRKDPT